MIGEKKIRFYSSHLENLGGHLDRVTQIMDIMKHVKESAIDLPVIIGGDLNTLMHGIIRFLPLFYPSSSSFLRFTTLGMSEAEWLESKFENEKKAKEFSKSYGFDEELCVLFSEFKDYFDKGESGATFWSEIYSIYCSKLDWILINKKLSFKSGEITGKGLSDHYCIINEIKIL